MEVNMIEAIKYLSPQMQLWIKIMVAVVLLVVGALIPVVVGCILYHKNKISYKTTIVLQIISVVMFNSAAIACCGNLVYAFYILKAGL